MAVLSGQFLGLKAQMLFMVHPRKTRLLHICAMTVACLLVGFGVAISNGSLRNSELVCSILGKPNASVDEILVLGSLILSAALTGIVSIVIGEIEVDLEKTTIDLPLTVLSGVLFVSASVLIRHMIPHPVPAE